MALFRKSEVVVLNDTTSYDKQIKELKNLFERADGELKEIIAKRIQYLEYGKSGEDEILYQLKYSDMDMVVLRDLYIKSDDLSAQIDYYVITSKLNFVIECKNLYGNITITNKGDFVRSYTYNGKTIKEGIPSPITQNERHLLVLKNAETSGMGKLMTAISKYVSNRFTKSLIVLSNSKTIVNDKYAPKEIKNKVIRADGLAATIKKCCSEVKQAGISRKDMLYDGKRILSLCTENPNDYVAAFREQVEKQEEEKRNKQSKWICPRCGKHLVRRNSKNGPFIGCTGYPKCTYTRNISSRKGE